MAKQLNVNMSFNADTSKAKAALQDLQQSLTKIQQSSAYKFDDTSIRKGQEAARLLSQSLKEAVNVNTGKLDLSKFSQSLTKANLDIKTIHASLGQLGPEGQTAFLKLAQSINAADNSALSLGTKLTSLRTTLVNTAKWQISSSLLHGLIGAVRGAYGYAQDLNESLNNIRIVTGYNVDKMADFAEEANRAAKALSTSTTAYTDAALIYYQQGLGDKAVRERTDVTVKMANVSRQSAEEVSNQMTAIWNNFDDGSKKLEYYADVITALGAATASSSEEIATGLEKFSAVADTVGLSYEYATSALATITATTRQSADVVGTALKTLFARIQDLELGETLEDGTTLGKYSAALEVVGVNIKDINGEVKNMDTILDELGAKWNTIAKDEQIALAQTVAGTRQYAQLIALMDNWDFMQENLQTARGSEGTLQKQADIYAESWEAASKRVKAAAQGIYEDLISDKFFISALNGVEKFLSGIDNLISGLGGLKGILMLISSLVMQYYAKEMPRIISSLVSNFQVLSGAAQKTKTDMLASLQGELQNMTAGQNNKALQAQLLASQQVSKLTMELNEKQRTLSSTDLEAAKAKIELVQAYGQSATAIGQEIDLLEQENRTLTAQISRQVAHAGNSFYGSFGSKAEIEENEAAIVAAQQRITEAQEVLNSKLPGVSKGTEAYQKLVETIENAQNEIKRLEQAQAELRMSPAKLLNSYKELSTELSVMDNALLRASERSRVLKDEYDNLSSSGQGLDSLNAKIETQINNLEEAGWNVEELKQALAEGDYTRVFDLLDGELAGVDGRFNELDADIQRIAQRLIELGVDERSLEQMASQLGLTADKAEQLKNAMARLKAQQDLGINSTVQMSSAIATMAGFMMQLSMVINSIKNLGNIWSNEDLSTGEKLLQTMGALVPVFMVTSQLLKGQRLEELALAAARVLGIQATVTQTAAEAGSGAVKKVLTVTNFGLAASEWALLTPILLIVAALAALVAIVWVVVEAFKKWKESTPEGQLKKTKEALDDINDSYKELKDNLNDIKSQQETLKDLEKGTLEWNEAVLKLNQSILEVLQTYPKLAAAVKTSEEGYLMLDTASAAYKDFLDEQMAEVSARTRDYAIAQRNVNAQDIGKKQSQVYSELSKMGWSPDQISKLLSQGIDSAVNDLKTTIDEEDGETNAHLLSVISLLEDIYAKQTENDILNSQALLSDLQARGNTSFNDLSGKAQSNLAEYFTSKGATSLDPKDILEAYFQTYGFKGLNLTKGGSEEDFANIGGSGEAEDIINYLSQHGYEDLEKIGAALGGFSNIAKMLNMEDLSVSDEDLSQATKAYSNLINLVKDKELQKAVESQNFTQLSVEQLEKIKDIYKDITDDEAALLGTTTKEFFAAIDEAIQNQTNNILSGKTLGEIQSTIANNNKNAGSLNLGDTIDGEKYTQLSDGLKGYFKAMEDGTFKLMDDAEEFKNALAAINIKEALSGIDSALQATGNYNYTRTSNTGSLMGMSPEDLGVYTAEDYDLLLNYATTATLASTNLRELSFVTEELKDRKIDATMVVEAERQGLMDLATQYENCKEELNNLQRAYQENDEQAKKTAASNLELAISAAEQAAANGLDAPATEAVTKALKAENDELAKTPGNLRSTAEAASDAAVRFMRLNNGISDLYTNFKKYDTVLGDISKATTAAEKATIAFSKDGTALRETLADILDTSSDLIDADLLGHIDSSTLEEAAMGSEEAINRIRDAFIDAQAAAAGLAESEELQAFKDTLAGLEEGAVLDLDTDSFLYKLIEAQLAAGATAEDIQAMLSGFGLDADVTPFEQAMADAADVAAQTAVSVTESGDAIIAGGSINAETNTVTAGASDTQENVGFDEDVTITTVHGQGRVLQAGSGGGGNYANTASLYGVTDAAVVAAAASNDRTVPVDVYYPVAKKTVTPRKVTESADKTQSATAIKLSNIHKSAGGKVSTKNRTTTSPRSSGGGGGGGGSAPKHSARTSSGGVHRYSRSENTVSSLSKQIDRLGKARENAWGLKALNVMDQEVDKLGKLKDAYEGYIKEVAGTNWKSLHDKIQKGIALTQEDLLGSGGYLKKDLEAILNGRQISVQTEDESGNQQIKNIQRAGIASVLGAYGISGLEFDDLGRINNIDEINDAIDKAQQVWIDNWWNAFDATQQEDVANKNELAKRTAILDDLKESISLYNDETIAKLIELSDENQDLIYQIQDFHADILSSKLEFRVQLSENNIKRLETAAKILGDDFYKTAEIMSLLYSGNGYDQYQSYINRGSSYMGYYNELQEKFQLWQEDNNNKEGIDLEHFIEGSQTVIDGLYDTIDNLLSINEQMKEYYGNTLARAREELEKLTNQMAHHVNIMEHLKNIMSLLNKETDYDTLEKIIRSQMAMRKNAFDVSTKWHKEALADQLAAEEEYNKLLAAGQEENARVYKEAVLDKAIERTREAEEQMYADAEAYLESVNELYTNTINQIMAKHEKFLTDGFGWDFLSESISKASSIQEEYLTKTNQIYETNVLLRKLAQDIDKTDNTAAKSKLKNFSDEIVAMQQQERLSKNDLEIAKARYEVLQAEIALTDAQNAKSTVRLQRDNEGNYGYVYTADQGAIDNAQQNYADKQNDLYNLVLEQTNTYGQKLIELEKERDAEIAALAEEYRGAEGEKYQEYLQKKADLIQKYNDLFYTYEDSYNKGIMWLNRTAATDYSEAWITEYENVINKSRDYKNEIITEFDEVEAKMRDYHEDTKPILEETAIGLGDIDKKTQDVLDANTALANQITRNGGLIDALEGEIREVEDATRVWAEHYEEIMRNIQAMQDFANLVQQKADEASGVNKNIDYTKKIITAVQSGEYDWGSREMNQDLESRWDKIAATNMKPDWGEAQKEEYLRALAFYINEGLTGDLVAALDDFAKSFGISDAHALVSQYSYEEFLKAFNHTSPAGKNYIKYASGGYTGEWGDGGKLAILHQKELVLNAVDTANLLTTVQMVRELASAIDLRAAAANYSSGLSSSTLGLGGGVVEQEVTIHAEFPNVVNHTEIEDAFTNLINRASQFANRR